MGTIIWNQFYKNNCQIIKPLDDFVKFMKRYSKASDRERTKLWRKENSTLFYCFTPSFNPADFDKYENYELENKFYEDQINQRVMFVSEKIDEEYEEDRFLSVAQL